MTTTSTSTPAPGGQPTSPEPTPAAPAPPPAAKGESRLAVPVTAADHVRGPVDAPVTLVEYGDFECLETARIAPILKALQHRLPGSLRLVYRHFPISRNHPHAEWAAEAAEAAGAQGCFWEMHDTLFVHQHLLGDEHLDLYLPRLDVDPDRLRQEIAARVYAPHVQADYDGGARSGVAGTPALFVNGVRYDGYLDAESLTAAVEVAMPQSDAPRPGV